MYKLVYMVYGNIFHICDLYYYDLLFVFYHFASVAEGCCEAPTYLNVEHVFLKEKLISFRSRQWAPKILYLSEVCDCF